MRAFVNAPKLNLLGKVVEAGEDSQRAPRRHAAAAAEQARGLARAV